MINIYIAAHKIYNFPCVQYYIPIQVGKDLSDNELGILADNTGDNISIKNPNFCELTAIYWMWKNDISDYIGLVHYRRYFVESSISNKIILNSKLEEFFNSGIDVILPIKNILRNGIKPITVKEHYCKEHSKSDWEEVRKIIYKRHPNYIKSFNGVERKFSSSFFNMFIMRKGVFNDFCEWLFDILFELEKRIIISNDAYQARVFGFVSERLLNVYFYNYDKEKIVFLPVKNIEDNSLKYKIKNFMHLC